MVGKKVWKDERRGNAKKRLCLHRTLLQKVCKGEVKGEVYVNKYVY